MDIKGYQIYSWSQEESNLCWSIRYHRFCNKVWKSSWKIVKGAMVVARGTNYETLYTTAGCINTVVVVESASNSSL